MSHTARFDRNRSGRLGLHEWTTGQNRDALPQDAIEAITILDEHFDAPEKSKPKRFKRTALGSIVKGGNFGGGETGNPRYGHWRESDRPISIAGEVASFLSSTAWVKVSLNRMRYIQSVRSWARYLDPFAGSSDGTSLVFRDSWSEAYVVRNVGEEIWHSRKTTFNQCEENGICEIALGLAYEDYSAFGAASRTRVESISEYISSWTSEGLYFLKEWSPWMAVCGSREEANLWIQAGIGSAEVHDWRTAGFTTSSAPAWGLLGFDPAEAGAWRRIGVSCSHAARLRDVGASAAEMKRWLSAGWSLKAAVETIERLFDEERGEIEVLLAEDDLFYRSVRLLLLDMRFRNVSGSSLTLRAQELFPNRDSGAEGSVRSSVVGNLREHGSGAMDELSDQELKELLEFNARALAESLGESMKIVLLEILRRHDAAAIRAQRSRRRR